MKGGKERFMSELSAEQLQYVIDNGKKPNVIEAAKVILAHDFNMESA